jgi:2-iminoacetate synthase ThiH
VSLLVDRALEAAGLSRVAAARRGGNLSTDDVAALREADLLVLGALADRIRAEEVGPEVTVYTADGADGVGPLVVLPSGDGQDVIGLALLREVAVARVAGPPGLRVRVDWVRCGLELAQVCIGFGANELVGRIATKRGLPLEPGQLAGVGKKSQRELAQIVKQRELAGFIRRAGRVPVFIGADGRPDASHEAPAVQEAP